MPIHRRPMHRVRALLCPRPIAVLLIFLLLTATTNASPSSPFLRSYSQYGTLLFLSHSLLIRVSDLRASRGDFSGADRARLIAQKVEKFSGLGIWQAGLSVGWDYAKNYDWSDSDYSELHGVVSELNELASLIGELTRAESQVERGSWIARNYNNIFRIDKSVLHRFLKIFGESGALKEVAEAVQREVVDGGVVLELNELARLIGKLTRAESQVERGYWIARNHNNIFRIAKSVLHRFLKIFGESEVAEAAQIEVVDGALVRDCLELGSNDLKGLIQIIKDFASQYSSTDGYNSELSSTDGHNSEM